MKKVHFIDTARFRYQVGGAGYIGSHCCVELLDDGYDVVVVRLSLVGLHPVCPSLHKNENVVSRILQLISDAGVQS